MKPYYKLIMTLVVLANATPLSKADDSQEILSDKHIKVMIQAAKEAGAILKEGYDKTDAIQTLSKGATMNDFVTSYDTRSEKAIIDTLKTAFPEYGIISEESASNYKDIPAFKKGYAFVIDPLDGTLSFLYKRPHFCTSIGLIYDGVPIAGVVYNPAIDELFYAAKGQGAYFNGRRIHVNDREKVENSLIHTGVNGLSDNSLSLLKPLLDKTSRITRSGTSPILELAWIAAGRLDAYWITKMGGPWDIAGGAILVKEAGGVVMNVDGKDNYLSECRMIAGSPKLVETIMTTYFPGKELDGIQFGREHN